jgi:hypothetical protein
LADHGGVADRGLGILCAMVLVVAAVAGLSRGCCRRGAMALDRCCAVGAGLRGRASMRVGLWTHGTRHTSADSSAEAAGGGGFLSLRAQPHVFGILYGVDGIVGGFRPSKSGGDRGCVFGGSRRPPVCDGVRGAHAAKDVWRGIRGVLPQRPPLAPSPVPLEQMRTTSRIPNRPNRHVPRKGEGSEWVVELDASLRGEYASRHPQQGLSKTLEGGTFPCVDFSCWPLRCGSAQRQ